MQKEVRMETVTNRLSYECFQYGLKAGCVYCMTVVIRDQKAYFRVLWHECFVEESQLSSWCLSLVLWVEPSWPLPASPLTLDLVHHGMRNVFLCFLLQRPLFVSFLSKLIECQHKDCHKSRVICLGKRPACLLCMKRLWIGRSLGEDLTRSLDKIVFFFINEVVTYHKCNWAFNQISKLYQMRNFPCVLEIKIPKSGRRKILIN